MFGAARLLMEAARWQEAIPQLRQTLDSAYTYNLDAMSRQLCADLAQCYRQNGQPRETLQYAERAELMGRFLLDGARMRAVDSLEMRFQTVEKEKKLAEARTENLLQARRLARSYWIAGLLLATAVVAVLMARNYRQKRRLERLQAEKALSQAREAQRRGAARALLTGQEQERRRIARDLHDSLGGLLYALRLRLPEEAGHPEAALADAAIAENRRIIQHLLPATLERCGLVAALREWAERIETLHRLPVTMQLPDDETKRRPEYIESAIYRIAQELMHNTARHASAGALFLGLSEHAGNLELRVSDDGCGFDPAQMPPGFLKTVRSRVELLEGRLMVHSAPGHGTAVVVKIPVSMGEN